MIETLSKIDWTYCCACAVIYSVLIWLLLFFTMFGEWEYKNLTLFEKLIKIDSIVLISSIILLVIFKIIEWL